MHKASTVPPKDYRDGVESSNPCRDGTKNEVENRGRLATGSSVDPTF